MERLDGGATAHSRHNGPPTAAERFLGMRYEQSDSCASPPLELSEDDIFSTPIGSSPPSPAGRRINTNRSPAKSFSHNDYGILAALNRNLKTRSVSGSEYDARPVFNRKASALASLSSSLSPSPTISSKIMIPRPPPLPQADKVRFYHQSAPVDVPAMPKALQRKVWELEDAESEGEEEEERNANGEIMPPHEVVASRHSPMLACSVLEGAGRTLKGRDLRQVRNAIWRKTGFID